MCFDHFYTLSIYISKYEILTNKKITKQSIPQEEKKKKIYKKGLKEEGVEREKERERGREIQGQRERQDGEIKVK